MSPITGFDVRANNWAYEVDDQAVTYGPGWYPFYMDGKPGHVRLAPDLAFYAWGIEYVGIGPGKDSTAEVGFYVTRDKRAHAIIDIRTQAITIENTCPAEHREIAEIKAARVLKLILAARSERRQGKAAPTLAHERYTAEQAMRIEYIDESGK